jgi:SAM-dependent methyltransferase
MAQGDWGSDFFGTLNELPPEPVGLLARVLEAMGTEPAFQGARRAVLKGLRLGPGARVLDAGCGTGVALPDLLAAGPGVRVDGVDPTAAFIELARARAARLGAAAGYEVGDIRALPYPDGAFDGAFCEKVLLHVGPARAALGELVRVTRPGGRVGAVEWCPFFGLSARGELAAAFNDGLRRAVYDYWVGPNLARHLAAAGLVEVETFLYVGQARSLGAHPFWRAFLLEQLPLFAHAGLIPEAAAGELAAELEGLDRQGLFWASFTVFGAVGTRPA